MNFFQHLVSVYLQNIQTSNTCMFIIANLVILMVVLLCRVMMSFYILYVFISIIIIMIVIVMIITGAVYVSQLLNVTHTLQKLIMFGNDIGDDGMAIISETLLHKKSFTTLHVGQCGLSVKGTVVCKMLYDKMLEL